jgi:AcrR family transcriptional regulator
MVMSIPYEATGRTAQKARTREALLVATRDLLADGESPTVERAAAAASISRTTAYRYFPNQRALLVAAHPETEAPSLLDDPSPRDPAERFEAAIDELVRLTVESEPQLRAALRLSLDPEPDHRDELLLRRGRAIGWLEDALAPVRERIGEAELRRLVLAVRSACGIEALVWLTDVAGLRREEAGELMRWSARSLFRAATADPTGADLPDPATYSARPPEPEG